MAKRTLHYQLTVISPRGNVGYSFYRDMKYDDVPLVVILRRKGHETTRAYIKRDAMNDVMYRSVMRNFKDWCCGYTLNSIDFDPKTDRIVFD